MSMISLAGRRVAPLLLLALVLAACDSSAPEFIEDGASVTMAYEGRLENGNVFDSSSAATFTIARATNPGDRGLIPGFYDGVLGLAVGEEKTFDIPPDQAHGQAGIVNAQTGEVIIPPNETLTFYVRILAIQ